MREGNTILGVDMCTNHVPHYITFPKSKLPSGYSVKKNRAGSSFEVSVHFSYVHESLLHMITRISSGAI